MSKSLADEFERVDCYENGRVVIRFKGCAPIEEHASSMDELADLIADLALHVMGPVTDKQESDNL